MLRLSRTIRSLKPDHKIFASAYITQYPLIQPKSTDLAELYHELQQNLQHKKSIKSDFEIDEDLSKNDWVLKNNRELNQLENLDNSVSEPNQISLSKKLHFTTPPVEWDGHDTILQLAQKSAAEDVEIGKICDFLEWPSTAPVAVDVEKNENLKIFYVPAFLNVDFDAIEHENIQFDSWKEDSKFAI